MSIYCARTGSGVSALCWQALIELIRFGAFGNGPVPKRFSILALIVIRLSADECLRARVVGEYATVEKRPVAK